MNERPKIGSLSEKELAQLLIDSFFLVGRDVKLPPDKLKILLKEVYKKQGWMYTDTFSEAFSRFAAFELPDMENLHPRVSPQFISHLMKLHFKKQDEKKPAARQENTIVSVLTPEEKYILFVQFISANKCVPANSDWVAIYEHIGGLKKLSMPVDWSNFSFYTKWNYAMHEVKHWAYSNFTINELLLFKNKNPQDAYGMGTRLGETLRNIK